MTFLQHVVRCILYISDAGRETPLLEGMAQVDRLVTYAASLFLPMKPTWLLEGLSAFRFLSWVSQARSHNGAWCVTPRVGREASVCEENSAGSSMHCGDILVGPSHSVV